jgi:Protein of unknown function (DUF2782)
VAPNRSPRSWAVAILLAAVAQFAAASDADREATGPDVTIVVGEERTVYEYRQAGQLRMIKIVPKHGRPYYLVPRDDTRGFGDLNEADMLIPSWKIIEF